MKYVILLMSCRLHLVISVKLTRLSTSSPRGLYMKVVVIRRQASVEGHILSKLREDFHPCKASVGLRRRSPTGAAARLALRTANVCTYLKLLSQFPHDIQDRMMN